MKTRFKLSWVDSIEAKGLFDWLRLAALLFGVAGAFALLGYDLSAGCPEPIDHQLDALRAAQVRAWTSGTAVPEVAVEGLGPVRILSITERVCCLDCDGHVACASVVECGGGGDE